MASRLRVPHRHVQRDTLLLLVLQTFYRLSGVVLLAVLSRCLPANEIGKYFFALSFAESFTLLASFCLGPVLMRRVAADPEQATTYFAPMLGLRLASSPLYLCCVSVTALAFTGAIWWVVVIVALFTLLENCYFSFIHLFLALHKVVYNVVIGIAVQTIFLAVFLIGMWWAPSLNILLEANLLRALGLVGAAMFVTHRWLCPLRIAWDSTLIKDGAPFILLTLLVMLRGRVDTLLLGFFTDYDTVGQYQLAFRVVFTTFFVPTTVSQALFPHLAAYGLSCENRRMLVYGVGGLLGLGLLSMGLVFFWAAPLTTLVYGPQAGAVTLLLRPLTLLFPLGFLSLFLSTVLPAVHQENKVLVASAIGIGTNILANCAFIPLWGACGTVSAVVLATLIELSVLTWHFGHLFATPPATAQPYAPNGLPQHIAGLE
jgi:O-antigen/teichoic acid export membrane protein